MKIRSANIQVDVAWRKLDEIYNRKKKGNTERLTVGDGIRLSFSSEVLHETWVPELTVSFSVEGDGRC